MPGRALPSTLKPWTLKSSSEMFRNVDHNSNTVNIALWTWLSPTCLVKIMVPSTKWTPWLRSSPSAKMPMQSPQQKRAKKAAQASASGTSTNPFSTIKTKGSPDLAQHFNKLTETLNKIDFKQRPYKPQIYPRGRGRGRGRRGQPWGWDQGCQNGYQGNRGGYQQNYHNQHRGGYRGRQHGGKFDKSPTKRNPRVNSKTKDADKDHCRYCHEIGHWERECPQKKKDETKIALWRAEVV